MPTPTPGRGERTTPFIKVQAWKSTYAYYGNGYVRGVTDLTLKLSANRPLRERRSRQSSRNTSLVLRVAE